MDHSSSDALIDYYRLLGVASDASAHVIEEAIDRHRREARRRAASPETLQDAQRLLSQVADAERLLFNPVSRTAYDRDLAAQRTPSPRTTSSGATTSLIPRIRAAFDQGDYRTAGTLSAEATKILNSSEAWYWHSRVLAVVNQYDQAASAARNAVNLDPGNAQYLLQLAICLEQAGDMQAAHKAYEAVNDLAPRMPWGRTGIARILLNADRVPDALQILEVLHHEFPGDSDIAEAYAQALVVAADNVPHESYTDGTRYTTSKAEVEQMRALVTKALSLPFDNPGLRNELQSFQEEVENQGKVKFVFMIILSSLRWSLFWWIMTVALILIGIDAVRMGDPVWLLPGLLLAVIVFWRAWAPQWRHNRRRQFVRYLSRKQQRESEATLRQSGREI